MTDDAARPGVLARAVIAVIGVYRTAISPLRPATCRYTPTCSAYALDAVRQHGAGRGGWLALRRLLRCHPFHAGGHDPVPAVVGRRGAGAAGTRAASRRPHRSTLPIDSSTSADSMLATLPRSAA